MTFWAAEIADALGGQADALHWLAWDAVAAAASAITAPALAYRCVGPIAPHQKTALPRKSEENIYGIHMVMMSPFFLIISQPRGSQANSKRSAMAAYASVTVHVFPDEFYVRMTYWWIIFSHMLFESNERQQ